MAIFGTHAIIHTSDADGVRALFRDALGLPFVDAGGGWLIFALPPAEIAAHPGEGPARAELYLMCDDIDATIADLRGNGVETTGPVAEEPWGLVTEIALPGGGSLGLYEPRHPRP
jgi:predicted enzyme related to lactoylglutathione lyase